MTRAQIIFNYERAMKQADKLDSIAKEVDRLANTSLPNTLGLLRTAWLSDNSPQFCSKVEKVREDIHGEASDIRKAAQSIRTIANAIKKAELSALAIAQERSYTG